MGAIVEGTILRQTISVRTYIQILLCLDYTVQIQYVCMNITCSKYIHTYRIYSVRQTHLQKLQYLMCVCVFDGIHIYTSIKMCTN